MEQFWGHDFSGSPSPPEHSGHPISNQANTQSLPKTSPGLEAAAGLQRPPLSLQQQQGPGLRQASLEVADRVADVQEGSGAPVRAAVSAEGHDGKQGPPKPPSPSQSASLARGSSAHACPVFWVGNTPTPVREETSVQKLR